ncbi:hypothetical protein AJ79_00275 [Helicocarpus griseus UAMH5409]|uniref:Myocyte-specific enhancer factor 2d n=1 Tax=Helicocarpus griseus UAMH5409 TaxID=1447875 RepID=A0A2B7YDB7_9EURO|nr:hypothetical protein AJ79_00275 [Helicocarpus griseus UAMH5409]
MSTIPREIPGYYYDPEKKKYFKIQANHAAPSGSKYTRDAIKSRQEKSLKRKRFEEHTQRVSKEKIKRSDLLHCPLGGALLQRESGSLPTSRGLVAQRRGEACARLLSRNRLVDTTRWGCGFPVSTFARDPWSGNLLVAINTASHFNLLSYPPKGPDRPWQYKLDQKYCDRLMTGFDWAQLGGCCNVASSDPTGESVNITTSKLTNPLDARPASQYVVDTATTFAYPGSMVWCSAPCPSTTSSIFAAGKVNDLLLVTGIESDWNTQTVEMSPNAEVNVMSVEWLTSRVVMSGLTNSLVLLHDIRSRDTASRLQHRHGVFKVRKVDDWRIVVAGAEKNLQMYDLRYAPTGIVTHPQPNKMYHTATKSYLSFPDYGNDYIAHDELDISPELDLLACASPSNNIQLFSLSSGKLIIPFNPNQLQQPPLTRPQRAEPDARDEALPVTHFEYPDAISCLRFENLEETPAANGGGNTGKPSLLVSAKNMVDEWRM